jgi:thiol:disulfide interchange protein
MAMKIAAIVMGLCAVVILALILIMTGRRGPVVATVNSAGGGSSSGSQYTGTVPREIVWEHDMQAALRSATDGNRVVVVDVYTDWCGWCKRMDSDVYRDQQVAALGSEAVFLKLNAEDHSEGQRFARDHGVRGFPTTIIMDASGRALQQQAGYISPPTAFVQWVHQARHQ